jgi:PEP-CTERM motif
MTLAKRVVVTGIVLTSMAFASLTAHAQAFENLNFESAVVVSNDPMSGDLDWDLAVPGWAHGGGPDSGTVYRGMTHLGITPWYLLVDATAEWRRPLQGSYSISFASGHADAQSNTSEWVESFVSQHGVVPVSARSVRFLATGPIELRLNGTALPLVSVGQNAFAANIAGFAGNLVELRFANISNEVHDAVVIDSIRFSPTAVVPEPASVALALAGLGLIGVVTQRRRRGS